MKNKKTAIIAIAAIIVVAAAAITTVLIINNSSKDNGSNSNQSSSSSSSTSGSIWSKDGVELKSATLEYVGEGYYNIVTIFANNTSSDVEFDTSKLKFVLADGYELKSASTSKTLQANRSRIQFAQSLSKEENSHLHLDDTVEVYYDGVKIDTNKVKEF